MKQLKTSFPIFFLWMFCISLNVYSQSKAAPPKIDPRQNNPNQSAAQENNKGYDVKDNPVDPKQQSANPVIEDKKKITKPEEQKKGGQQKGPANKPTEKKPIEKKPVKQQITTKPATVNPTTTPDTVKAKSHEVVDADYDFETGRWIALTNDGWFFYSDSFPVTPQYNSIGITEKLNYNSIAINWKLKRGSIAADKHLFVVDNINFKQLSWGSDATNFFGSYRYYSNIIFKGNDLLFQLFEHSTDSITQVVRGENNFSNKAGIPAKGIWCKHFLFSNTKSSFILSSFTNNSILYYKNESDSTPQILNSGYNKISILTATTDSSGNALVLANDSLNHGILFKTKLGDTTAWAQVPVFRKNKTNIGEMRHNFTLILIFIIFLLVLIIFLARNYFEYIAELKKKQQEKEKASNPLVFAAEMPTSNDTLNIFGTTVDSVVELIKNPSTQPPLSIILSGAWGSGKSSLMAQIKKKLEEENKKAKGNEFVMLWFNIWHFQSAQHMLVVFLSSIMHLFEKTFKFRFRYNLFMNRLKRLSTMRAIQFYFTFFLLVPLLFFILLQIKPFDGINYKNIWFLGPVFSHILSMIEKIDFTSIKFTDKLPLAIPVVSWIAGFILLGKKWQAWGLQSFFRVISLDRMQEEAKKEDPGFREKYKQEFWEIMQASEQKNYVIFIDDTDRISGDKIKEMLEGINFITDTASRPGDITLVNPRIYFIMAMAAEEVAKNLGQNLINKPGSTDDDNLKAGAMYLEKIVDIVIPVPLVSTSKDDDIVSLTDRHH